MKKRMDITNRDDSQPPCSKEDLAATPTSLEQNDISADLDLFRTRKGNDDHGKNEVQAWLETWTTHHWWTTSRSRKVVSMQDGKDL